MVAVPSAIVMVNQDLTAQVRAHIIKQLHISEAVFGAEFDSRIEADPDYVNVVKSQNMRILVERPYTELDNRTEADVVIFIKNGLASVLKNNFGPPGKTFPVLNLHWGQFCIFL